MKLISGPRKSFGGFGNKSFEEKPASNKKITFDE
jgi:hypothetical protein